ncbi:MAG TPA: TfoX/Sxy family protein [Methylomirabilota bacterium]|nr:TfoX/Sxy family protein [Methylomirabilota bacterium]
MPRVMPKFSKTPPEIVAAFDAASPSRGDIERKTMFSYPALFVRGNMFAFTFGPKIAVRANEATRAKPGMKRFEPMPGRPMGEYVEVPAKDMKGAPLKRWMAEGLAYADTLPAKAKAKKKPAAKKPVAKKK